MIVAKNLFKTYKKTEALRNVSVEIADGDFAVILGTSGSGKSTLMNILSGLERCDRGEVAVEGLSLPSLSEKQLTQFRKENIGFVFQQYYLLPHLTAEYNIKLGADLANSKPESDLIDALGLSDKLKKRPDELSGGEQQRVCIARALAKKPKYLFLDEPTGALDEKTGREVLDCIMKEKSAHGFTMIMVTHNQNIAEMAQTVIRMNSGSIVEVRKNSRQKSAYEIGW